MKTFFDSAAHAAISVVCLILIAMIMLLSGRSGQIEINEGDVSSVDIYAPRAIVDETTTAARREAAKKSVENVYTIDSSKTSAAKETVNSIFSSAAALRENTDENEPSNGTNLAATAKINLSKKSGDAIMTSSDKSFSAMRTLSDIVETVMGNGVSDIEEAKKSCDEKINGLKINDVQKSALNEICASVLTVNLELNEDETLRRKEAAAAAVPVTEYKKNQIILRKGEIVSKAQLDMLRSLGILKGSNPILPTYTLGIVLFMLLCFTVIICGFFPKRKKLSAAVPITSVMALISVAMAFYGTKILPERFIPILPLGFLPCVTAIFSSAQPAIIANLSVSVLCGVAFDSGWSYALCMIIGGSICAYAFSRVKQRTQLLPAGIVSAFSYGLSFCAMSLVEASSAKTSLVSFCFGFCGGFLSGILTIGTLPSWEWLFNVTTPMKLTELANPENKLLKRLLIEAPGTYHHSLTVANIAEIAAREIKANSLLARVGAYYHDIGKLRHPLYFKENQYDENIHDNLSPEESARVIIQHVSDGAEIAQKHRLPPDICAIIAQHHGTTSVGYFLLRAKEKNKDADPAPFHYPGPQPSSKEAAIVMLADSCEAAVRSLSEKSESKIEQMVRRIVRERTDSGQFNECNLTFAELEKVIRVITKTLGGYFHERIKYE